MPSSGFPQEVTTPRLSLRRFGEERGEAMAAVWADRDVWQACVRARPSTPTSSRAGSSFTCRPGPTTGSACGWSRIARAASSPAGWAPWHPTFVPELADRIEIGWTLRRPFWGRGLAAEGAEAAVGRRSGTSRPTRSSA